MGILKACTPRAEVLKGDLEDAIFAADFGQLVSGTAPAVYGDAEQFFRNTHPAEQLKRIVEAVFTRLKDPGESGATIRLSTGFGGGKTHTLMALWHLGKHIGDFGLGVELLPGASRPSTVTVAGIDAGQAGVPNFATKDGKRIKSLAGALAFELKGESGLTTLGEADTIDGSPNESEIRAMLPDGPVLILIDELVVYMAQLNAEQQGNLMGFMKRLMSVVQSRPQTALVVTDPAAQPAYAAQAAVLSKQLQGALKLDNIYGRSMSDFDPIKQEGAKVIARRLFESVDPKAAQMASASYADLYDHVSKIPNLLPKEASDPEYAKRLVECYPFHPRLLDSAQDRLGALSEFNKSRGVLRLFARIIRDVWERNEDIELVTAGDIDWTSPRIQADLLDRLDRQNFRAAVNADVDGHAGELDGDVQRGVHRRVASALLLESIPLEANSALNKPELTLATLRPSEAGHEPAEAIDNLLKVCWHTYITDDGQAYQFRYHPNVNKQIEERMATVKLDEAEDRVRSQVQKYFSGPVFSLAPWPRMAKEVPNVARLQLALCFDEDTAKSVCKYADDDPAALMPRSFINAILAVAPSKDGYRQAVERAQRLIAAERILEENRKTDNGKLTVQQLEKLLPDLNKQFRLQSARAFNRVVLANTSSELTEEYLVSEETLATVNGQAALKRFIDDKKWVYQPTDRLDTDLFMDRVLPGATPTSTGVYSGKAIHERFLSASELKLLSDQSVVRNTILRAISEGKLVAHLESGAAYDRDGKVDGLVGSRTRTKGETIMSFPLTEDASVALPHAELAESWLKVDEPTKPGDPQPGGVHVPPPPTYGAPPVDERKAVNWESAIEKCAVRKVETIGVTATTGQAGALLTNLAVGFSPDSQSLDVYVSGKAKDGGQVSFKMSGVKPSHPAKPMNIALTLFNSLEEDGRVLNAKLTMSFGTGRVIDPIRFEQAQETAPSEVELEVRFS